MKKFFSIMVFLFIGISLSSCSKNTSDPYQPESNIYQLKVIGVSADGREDHSNVIRLTM